MDWPHPVVRSRGCIEGRLSEVSHPVGSGSFRGTWQVPADSRPGPMTVVRRSSIVKLATPDGTGFARLFTGVPRA
jgi:hypothetical protein